MNDMKQKQKKQRKRMKWQILIPYFVSSFFLLLVIGILVFFSYDARVISINTQNEDISKRIAGNIDSFIFDLVKELEFSGDYFFCNACEQQEYVNKPIQSLLNLNEAFNTILFFDSGGKLLNSTVRYQKSTIKESQKATQETRYASIISVALNTSVAMSEAYLSDDELPLMQIASKVLYQDGSVGGVVVAEIDLTQLWSAISQISVGESGQIYIVDGSGKLVISRDLIQMKTHQDMSSLPIVQDFLKNKQTTKEYESFNNEWVYGHLHKIKAINWGVLVERPKSEIITQLVPLIVVTGIAIVVFILTIVFMISLLVNRIIYPISQLYEGARRLQEGDTSYTVVTSANNELDELTDNFNSMALSIKESYAVLEEKVNERTHELLESEKKLEEQNVNLHKAQNATLNLLEDLEMEKQIVEKRVIERTEGIENEKSKLFQVASNMSLGVILLNPQQEIVFINYITRAVLGLKIDENSSKVIFTKLFNYFGKQKMKSSLERLFSDKRFTVPEISGGGRLYSMYLRALHDTKSKEEKISGYFIQFEDITDVKILERSKTELVAVASHQLRTPLTAMRGNVELLADESYGSLNKEQHELVTDMEESTVRLIQMVNEMLDITRIEKGDLEMVIEPINVKDIIYSIAHNFGTYAERHNFVINIDEIDSGATIYADTMRTRQIFQNLIDNAIKYSRNPGVLNISTKMRGSLLEIHFKDNGIGVPKNEIPKLFTRFYRASNTVLTASSGSGLGLYIIKAISKEMGGDITVESIENEGTTFTVLLPIHT